MLSEVEKLGPRGRLFMRQPYRGHFISVSVIYDTPNHYQFTPVVEIRRPKLNEVLNTIVTKQAFNTIQMATEFGFGLGREWVDERLLEFPE